MPRNSLSSSTEIKPIPKSSKRHKYHKDKTARNRTYQDTRKAVCPPVISPDLIPSESCVMNDGMAHQLETLWKSVFPDTMFLLGSSSGNNGMILLTHSLGPNMLLQMNGLPSSSLLAKNAFYSVECSHGKYINLYEIKLPHIPGRNGEPSTVQLYINALAEQGLDVAGNSPSWPGSLLNGFSVSTISSSKVGLDPFEFSHRTLRALRRTLAEISHRSL